MFITNISMFRGSAQVLTTSNNRSSIIFTTGIKKEFSSYNK